MAQPRTHTIRIDPATGRLDQRSLCLLLMDVEQYLDADMVDTDDDAARLAANVLWRHFGAAGPDCLDTTEEGWADEELNNVR